MVLGTVILCGIACAQELIQDSVSSRSPDVYMNQLRPEYGVNFKYNGMIAHSLERMWVVLRIPLPDLEYLVNGLPFDWVLPFQEELRNCSEAYQNMNKEEQLYASSMKGVYNSYPCELCKRSQKRRQDRLTQISEELRTIVSREFPAALPQLFGTGGDDKGPTSISRSKRFAFLAALGKVAISGLVPIASELVSSKIRKKRNKAVVNAINALRSQVATNTQEMYTMKDQMVVFQNKVLDLTKGVGEALQAHKEETKTQMNAMYEGITTYLRERDQGLIRELEKRDRYMSAFIKVHMIRTGTEDACRQLMDIYDIEMIGPAERVLAAYKRVLRSIAVLGKGYLPQELVGFTELQGIINNVTKVIRQKGGAYVPALESIYHYYDMKLVSFMVDPEAKDMVVTFPVLLKPVNMDPLKLYEIETVHVPVEDQDPLANTYTRVVTSKPYIATAPSFYIQLRIPELRMCKVIGFEYFCEELFTMKHRMKHTCESTLFYRDSTKDVNEHCEFEYHYNKTVIPSVLDGGDTVVLANMKQKKSLTCRETQNLEQPAQIPPSSYVTVSRSLLCGCHLTSDLVTVMSSLSACDINSTAPKMLTFQINPAFLGSMKNLSHLLHQTPLDLKLPDVTIDYMINNSIRNTPVTIPCSIPDVRNPDSKDRPDTLSQLLSDAEQMQKEFVEVRVENQKAFDAWLKDQKDNPPESLSWINRWEVIFFNCLAALAVIFVCIIIAWVAMKQKAMRSMIYGYMGANLPMTKAFDEFTLPPEPPATVVCQNRYITYIMTVLSIITVCVVIYRLYKSQSLCKGIRLNGLVQVYLTISSNERLVRIKLKEVQAHLGLFMIVGCMKSDQLQFLPGTLRGRLNIDWSGYSLFYDGRINEVPNTLSVGFFPNMQLKSIFRTNTVSAYFEIKRGDGWWIPRHSLIVPPRDGTLHDDELALRRDLYHLEQDDDFRQGAPSRGISNPLARSEEASTRRATRDRVLETRLISSEETLEL